MKNRGSTKMHQHYRKHETQKTAEQNLSISNFCKRQQDETAGSEGVDSFRRPRAIVNHPVDNYTATRRGALTSRRVEIENYLIPLLCHLEHGHRKATPQKIES